jgi:peptidoglycan hydrolase CwlO-like protein
MPSEYGDFITQLIGSGTGLGGAWIMAKTLFGMYQKKDARVDEVTNARIADMQSSIKTIQEHANACHETNSMLTKQMFRFTEEIANIKRDVAIATTTPNIDLTKTSIITDVGK